MADAVLVKAQQTFKEEKRNSDIDYPKETKLNTFTTISYTSHFAHQIQLSM